MIETVQQASGTGYALVATAEAETAEDAVLAVGRLGRFRAFPLDGPEIVVKPSIDGEQ
ncbi:MAG: hypothetical protein J0H98_08195 [Solirubrobacterales bacterium]|nr:hypothetical protein [Solirubrobacterales bacterium]